MSEGEPPVAGTTHQAWLEIDLDALSHNARALRGAIPAQTRLGILVKANGYGHGLEMAARAAIAGGADQLIVAALDEGLALRRAAIDAPVLIVYPIPVAAVDDAVESGLELSVTGAEGARLLLEAWATRRTTRTARRLDLHVEVDTGMGRGGVAPARLGKVLEMAEASPSTRLAGIWSHLADGRSTATTGDQMRRFEAALEEIAASGRSIPPRHVAATEGVFAGTAPAYEMVRIGLAFYGELGLDLQPAPASRAVAAALRPAMAVKALAVRIEEVAAGATVGYGSEWVAQRRSLIATLPIGYADGWTRAYWPGACALVRGRRVPLVGRVSMDSVCADVTDAGEIGPGEEFVLLGGQGKERITPNELSRLRGSIPNEVFCAFGPRLPRVYLGDAMATDPT